MGSVIFVDHSARAHRRDCRMPRGSRYCARSRTTSACRGAPPHRASDGDPPCTSHPPLSPEMIVSISQASNNAETDPLCVAAFLAGTMERMASLAGSVRIPEAGSRIYKDECVLSFDTPVRGMAAALLARTQRIGKQIRM